MTLAVLEPLNLIFHDLNQWDRLSRWFGSWRFASIMS